MEDTPIIKYLQNFAHDWEESLEEARNAAHAAEGEGLEEHFGPFSMGMHELLDRISLVRDQVETNLLDHPSAPGFSHVYQALYMASCLLGKAYNDVAWIHMGEDH